MHDARMFRKSGLRHAIETGARLNGPVIPFRGI